MEVSIAVVVIVAIIPISMLFYFMDRHWYHRLLLGAVMHCAEIERSYVKQLPEIQLGTIISKLSPVHLRDGGGGLYFSLYVINAFDRNLAFIQIKKLRFCINR